MTIDSYAPCPCGSGKKMKFCKCVDQPQEYEKIVRLIEGDQQLAAMDRVNQLLAKSPSAAWLLALKGELALGLQEIDTFRETASRFLKLKPDNPLAISMRAFVALLDDEPTENAARLLLQGMAESRESLPFVIVDGLVLLIQRLTVSDKAAMRFYWLRTLEQITASIEDFDMTRVRRMLPTDNALSIAPVLVPPVPAGAPWSERANEVLTLVSGFRHVQAETKLRSILRDFPDQPWPLLQLLDVQLVLLDQEGAVATCRKLSSLRDLDESTRDIYAALELDLEAGRPRLSPESLVHLYEINSEESAREALSQLPFVDSWQEEHLRQYGRIFTTLLQEEVNPRVVYEVAETRTTAGGQSYQLTFATIALFGRQTDKPPRAIVELVDEPLNASLKEQVLAAIGSVNEQQLPQRPTKPSYITLLARHRVPVDENAAPIDDSQAMVEEFLTMRLPALNNLTLQEAVQQEPLRAQVRAVLMHLEGAQSLLISRSAFDSLYARLELPRKLLGNDDFKDARNVRLIDMMRSDLPQLSNEVVARLFIIGHSALLRRLVMQAGDELLSRPKTPETEKLRLVALQYRTAYTDSLDDALKGLEQLQVELAEQKLPVGEVIVRRIDLLMRTGRFEEGQVALQDAIKNHITDPHVMGMIQMMNQSMQQQQAGGGLDDSQLINRLGRRNEPDMDSESSLVLPGQSSQPGEPGKSKLWLPGS